MKGEVWSPHFTWNSLLPTSRFGLFSYLLRCLHYISHYSSLSTNYVDCLVFLLFFNACIVTFFLRIGYMIFKKNFFFNWSIVYLQCLVSFRCIAQWFRYTFFLRFFSLLGIVSMPFNAQKLFCICPWQRKPSIGRRFLLEAMNSSPTLLLSESWKLPFPLESQFLLLLFSFLLENKG